MVRQSGGSGGSCTKGPLTKLRTGRGDCRAEGLEGRRGLSPPRAGEGTRPGACAEEEGPRSCCRTGHGRPASVSQATPFFRPPSPRPGGQALTSHSSMFFIVADARKYLASVSSSGSQEEARSYVPAPAAPCAGFLSSPSASFLLTHLVRTLTVPAPSPWPARKATRPPPPDGPSVSPTSRPPESLHVHGQWMSCVPASGQPAGPTEAAHTATAADPERPRQQQEACLERATEV